MSLQQMAEVQDGGFVRHAVVTGIEPGEGTHEGDVVQGFFHGGIGEGEPLLHEVDAEHGVEGKGSSPATGFGVVGFDQGV